MNRKTHSRRGEGIPGVGSASLILIFFVLCLTVFALLTLATARNDYRLSQKSVAATEAFYAADSNAEAVLATLRAGFLAGRTLPGNVDGVAIQAEDGGVYAYRVPINEQQALDVRVQFQADGSCRILAWEAVSTVEWLADDTLNLWDGSLPGETLELLDDSQP